jgi:phosphoribosylanthranilate isomerase
MWIKICGLTGEDAVAAALDAQVDAIGFVFAPSVRRLDPAQAAQLAAIARTHVSLIAVTLHPDQTLIDRILHEFKPDVLQTDLEDFERLRLPATLQRLPVVRPGASPAAGWPRRMLFEGARSGSGDTADWTAAAQLARSSDLILAGGLDVGNVAAAIRAVRPFGVDVSSGVEGAPGLKSPQKIAQFVAAARAAFQGIVNDGNRYSG